MGEHKFTKHFKNNLTDNLNELFEQNEYELIAESEFSVPSFYGRNAIDIGIYSKKDVSKIVGIEIEFVSCQKQITINRDKFRNWVNNSKYRSGGLLHIICADAKITQNKLYELLIHSYEEMSTGREFYYEFFALKEFDRRETQYTAQYILEDWEFDARLFSLLHKVFF